MRKTAGHISMILRGILMTGFSIQIAFGVVWMCFHFACRQEFGGSAGILYRGIRALAGGRYWLIYILQLMCGGYAGYRFVRIISPGRLRRNIWESLVLLTFPMAMQCHMALSPCSLVSSFFMLELSAAVSVVRGEGEAAAGEMMQAQGRGDGPVSVEGKGFLRKLAGGALCWAVLALLLPEYFILGAVPLILAVLFRLPALIRRLSELGAVLLLLGAFGGMIVGIGQLSGEEGYLPDRESVCFALFSRMAWPTLWPDSEDWPGEVQAVARDLAWETSQQADNMQRIFRPLLREKIGEGRAAELYLEMALFSWKRHTFPIIRQIGGDFLGYCVTPLILPMQLEGEAYASYSGRNYEMMFQDTPVLTKYYVRYGCRWFAVMLVLAPLLAAVNRICGLGQRKRRGKGRRCFAQISTCLIPAGIVTALYTLRGAGVMDYKQTVAVGLLWLAAALFFMRGTEGEEEGMEAQGRGCHGEA